MVKVLIVDDSPTICKFLEFIFSNDKNFEVAGICNNGKQALNFVSSNKVDVVTMDVDMPVMNGLEATRRIMSTVPVPVIIVTAGRNARNQSLSMEALAAGALTVFEKPETLNASEAETRWAQLKKLVKIYAEVKVIKRKFPPLHTFHKEEIQTTSEKVTQSKPQSLQNKRYIAIGVSTGGPEVLKTLLPCLPANFPFPLLIVQHITEGFLEGMVNWLNSCCSIQIKVAENFEEIKSGIVYFAPNSKQMGVHNNRLVLSACEQNELICPSVNYLFESLSFNNASETIALLLTGMGSDGAEQLKTLKEKGALTIAQDKESSLIHGMPGQAIKIGAAQYVYSIKQIEHFLLDLIKYNRK